VSSREKCKSNGKDKTPDGDSLMPRIYAFRLGARKDAEKKQIDLDAYVKGLSPPKYRDTDPMSYRKKKKDVDRFQPPIFSERLAAQSSVFTIQWNPLIPIELIPKERLCGYEIVPKDIAPESADSLRRELHRFGVNQATLFPDLSGLTATLQWNFENLRGLSSRSVRRRRPK